MLTQRWTTRLLFVVMALLGGTASIPTSAAADAPACASFVVVHSDDPGTTGNILYAAASYSKNQAWAVGTQSNAHRVPHPLIERSAGGRGFAAVVGPPAAWGSLEGVAAPSPSRAIAVGVYKNGPLIEQWDGSSWTLDSNVPSGNIDLAAVDVYAASGAWAAGTKYTQGAAITYALQWDGASWTHVPTPSPSPWSAHIWGISARSDDDVWAVGDYQADDPPSDPIKTLVEHWDGRSWTVVDSPSPGDSNNTLFDVMAFGKADAWAVGGFGSSDGSDGSLLLHWDGRAWSKVGGIGAKAGLRSLDGRNSTDLWAAGFEDGPFVAHYDGMSWTRVAAQSEPGGAFHAVAESSPSTVWTVGEQQADSDAPYETMAERDRCSSNSG